MPLFSLFNPLAGRGAWGFLATLHFLDNRRSVAIQNVRLTRDVRTTAAGTSISFAEQPRQLLFFEQTCAFLDKLSDKRRSDLRVNEYTAFCNGPGDVKSPRVIVTPPSSRFCPWSAPRPPHYAVRRNGEPI